MEKYITIVGTPSSGKTTYLQKCINNCPSSENMRVALCFNSNIGKQYFGILCYPSLNGVFWPWIDGAIVMVEKTRGDFLDQVKVHINEIEKQRNIPIVVCGSKFDLVDEITNKHIDMLLSEILNDIPYFDISSPDEYNIEKPFLAFAKHFNNNTTVSFLEHKL